MRGCEHLIKILLMSAPMLAPSLSRSLGTTYYRFLNLIAERYIHEPRVAACSRIVSFPRLALEGVPRECPEWISGAACVHVQRTPRAIRFKCRSRERAEGVDHRRLKNLLAKSCIVSLVNWEISADRAGDKYGI